MPLLTNTTVLYAISEAEAHYGNAPHYRLYHEFVTRGPGTNAQLQAILAALESEDLIVRDGMRNDGIHYATTRKGKSWLVKRDLRPAA